MHINEIYRTILVVLCTCTDENLEYTVIFAEIEYCIFEGKNCAKANKKMNGQIPWNKLIYI